MRSTWTDSRLDDLNGRVGDLDGRVTELSSRVDKLSDRIDALQQTMLHTTLGMTVTMITGFVGLAGLIVTQA